MSPSPPDEMAKVATSTYIAIVYSPAPTSTLPSIVPGSRKGPSASRKLWHPWVFPRGHSSQVAAAPCTRKSVNQVLCAILILSPLAVVMMTSLSTALSPPASFAVHSGGELTGGRGGSSLRHQPRRPVRRLGARAYAPLVAAFTLVIAALCVAVTQAASFPSSSALMVAPYTAFAIPQIQLALGPPGFAVETVREDNPGVCSDLAASVANGSSIFGYDIGRTGCGVWERPIMSAMNLVPGTQGFARLYMGGSTCSGDPGLPTSNSPKFTTLRENAASVLTVLQTSFVYSEDTTVGVRYLLTDAKGRPRVSASGLTVRVTITAGGQTNSATCNQPNTGSGIGICMVSARGVMFSTSTDVAASAVVEVSYSGISAATSDAMQFTLKQRVAHVAPSAVTIYITLPTAPV